VSSKQYLINRFVVGASVATLMVAMSGCSNSNIPQESDLKEIFASTFANCGSMEVKDIKKLDGVQLQNGKYKVKTSFEVSVKPTEENAKLWAGFDESRKKYEAIVSQIRSEEKAVKKEIEEKEQYFDEQYKRATREEEKEKIYDVQKRFRQEYSSKEVELSSKAARLIVQAGLQGFENRQASVFYALDNGFGKVCKVTDQLSKKIFVDTVGSVSGEERAKIFGQGRTWTQTYNLELTKTEKGWTLYF